MGNETGSGDRKGHCNDREKECSPSGEVLPCHLVDAKHNGNVLEKSAHSKPPVSTASDATDILECLRQQLANGNASYISKIPSEMVVYSVDKLNSCYGHKSTAGDAAEKSNVSNVTSDVDVANVLCQDMLKDKWKSLQAESQSLVPESGFTVKCQRSVMSSHCGLGTGLTGDIHVTSVDHLDTSSGHSVIDGHHRLPVSTAVDPSCVYHPDTTGGVKNINIQRSGGGNLLEAKNSHCGGQTVAIPTSGHSVAMATECMRLNQLPVLASYDTAIVVRRSDVDKYAASDIGLLQSNVVTHHVNGMVVVPGSALVASYGVAGVLDTSALSNVILDNRLLAQTDIKDNTSTVHSQVMHLACSLVVI